MTFGDDAKFKVKRITNTTVHWLESHAKRDDGFLKDWVLGEHLELTVLIIEVLDVGTLHVVAILADLLEFSLDRALRVQLIEVGARDWEWHVSEFVLDH